MYIYISFVLFVFGRDTLAEKDQIEMTMLYTTKYMMLGLVFMVMIFTIKPSLNIGEIHQYTNLRVRNTNIMIAYVCVCVCPKFVSYIHEIEYRVLFYAHIQYRFSG